VAQDTAGEEAAGPFWDRANATFVQLLDPTHKVSTLYNMVNVPTGVWIDEEGRIVRPNEVAYSRMTTLTLGGKTLSADGDAYVAALRDWVAKGADSEYAMTPEEIAERMKPRTNDEAQAEAEFQLGVYFKANGEDEKASERWKRAQKLRPDSWNYHRQEWSFTPSEHGRKWMEKFQALGDEPYYDPLELESDGSE